MAKTERKMNKVPEKTAKEEKKIYKAKIKEQKKIIRQLEQKVERLTKAIKNTPNMKIVEEPKKKSIKIVDKKAELRKKLREQYSGDKQ